MRLYLLCLVINIGVVMPIGQRIFAGETYNVASKAPVKTEISVEEAKTIALKLVPGKIHEVEKEKQNGEKVYSVEITATDGVGHEVLINQATGVVIEDKINKSDDNEDDED